MWRRKLLVLATLAATAPGLGQAALAGTASVPNLSGVWAHASIPGFEPLAVGPDCA